MKPRYFSINKRPLGKQSVAGFSSYFMKLALLLRQS